MTQQYWVTDTLGGNLGIAKLSKVIRHAAQPLMKFRQFVDAKEAVGLNNNDTFVFDKVGNLAVAGGTLIETNTVPETHFVIQKGTLVVTEYGNAGKLTGKLSALAEINPKNVLQQALRNDQVKVLDSAAGTQFKATKTRYVALSASSGTLITDGTFTSTATGDLNVYHAGVAVDQLKSWNIPKYDGSNFICIASVKSLRSLRNDTAAGGWIDAAKYGDNQRLFSGEIGRLGGVRYIEETNVLSNAIGASSAYGEWIMFGADAVAEGIAIPEEIRVDDPTDLGRSQKFGWYALLGYKICWDYSTDTESHIIYAGSA